MDTMSVPRRAMSRAERYAHCVRQHGHIKPSLPQKPFVLLAAVVGGAVPTRESAAAVEWCRQNLER
jgi:hypothetical protein